MRFNLSVSAVLAMAASAFAQTPGFDAINIPTPDQTVSAGSEFTISWDAPQAYASGTVSLELIGGATQGTQQILQTIATGIQNAAGSYSWNVPASLGNLAVYGLIIRSESNTAIFQYSNPFRIQAGGSSNTSPSPSPNNPPAGAASTGAASTTITTPYGTHTVTLASQSSAVALPTTMAPVPTPPASVFRNATATAPSYNNSTAIATLATSTRLPPPPQTNINVPPSKVTTTAWAMPSANPPNTNGTAPSHAIPISDAGARAGASSMLFIGSLVMAILAL